MAAVAGPILPIGAIGVADPQDVLRATSAPQEQIVATGVRNTAQRSRVNSTSTTASTLRSHSSNRAGGPRKTKDCSSRSSSRSQSANDASPKQKRTHNTKSRRRRSVHTTRKQRTSIAETNSAIPEQHGSEDVPDVAVQFDDTRNELEKYIDDLIDREPGLRGVTTFAEGSVLDYIDMIGVSREEAFSEFPLEVADLPVVPGSRSIDTLLDHIKSVARGEEEVPERVGRTTTMSQKEVLLTEALRLECRRADLLAYQSMLLRTELVLALKRWKALTVGVLPGLVCDCVSDKQRRKDHRDRLRASSPAEPLSSGRFVQLRAEHAAVMDVYRSRRRDLSSDGGANGESHSTDDEDSDSTSVNSSEIWSSSSETEGEVH